MAKYVVYLELSGMHDDNKTGKLKKIQCHVEAPNKMKAVIAARIVQGADRWCSGMWTDYEHGENGEECVLLYTPPTFIDAEKTIREDGEYYYG